MRRRIAIAALFLASSACTGELTQPDDANTTPGETSSNQTSNTTPSPEPSDDMSAPDMQNPDPTPDMGGMDPMPTPSVGRAEYCAGRSMELRAGAGRVVRVEPAGPGRVTVDGSERTLRQVVAQASEGDIIELADGTYTFDEAGDGQFTGVYITTPNITIRSASGDASAVVLDSAYRRHGNQSATITIAAAGVTVQDLSVQRAIFHLIHLWEAGDEATIHNVRLIDGGQQFLKSSGGDGTIDDVSITCSDFLMTDEGRDNVWGYGNQGGNTTCYTGGIDSHEGQGWWVADNTFCGIYCDATGVQRPAHGKVPGARGDQTYQGGLSEHAIHLWDSPEGGGGHVIERNHIIDCARGIGLGFRAEVFDIVVRHNFISSVHAGSREHDVGIELQRSKNSQVYHNTLAQVHPEAYANSIEYRFDVTSGLSVFNNLTTGLVRARDGAEADASHNVEVDASVFVDAAAGDLHLSSCDMMDVVGAGRAMPDIAGDGALMDFDHDVRDGALDIGADQCE